LKKVYYKLLPLALGLFVLGADAKTKKLALLKLQDAFSPEFPYGGKAIFHNFLSGIDFSLNLVANQGAAWGIFSNYPNLLTYARIGIVLFLLTRIFKSSIRLSKRMALSLICAGAIGNVLDHYKYGYVIDMFHFSFWNYDFPVFNLADAAIFLGTLWLVLSKGKVSL
jgi:signal peptidase II